MWNSIASRCAIQVCSGPAVRPAANYCRTEIIDADVNGDSAADMQILFAGTNFIVWLIS
jgi:hypothetical protein